MLRRILYISCVFIVSPEFVVFISCAFINWAAAPFLERMSLMLTTNSSALEWLTLFPSVCFPMTLQMGRKLLLPGKGFTNTLRDWPAYELLKVHAYVSFFYGIIFALLGLSGWFVPAEHLLGILGTASAGALTCAATNWLADLKLSELMGKED